MIAIVLFILCIVIAIFITFAYIRLLAFEADRHPSWVGEGLRKRLLGRFRSTNAHGQESKPVSQKVTLPPTTTRSIPKPKRTRY